MKCKIVVYCKNVVSKELSIVPQIRLQQTVLEISQTEIELLSSVLKRILL